MRSDILETASTSVAIRVLQIEDNPDDGFLVERHLRRNGFSPTIARVETAQDMLAELHKPNLPDIILADYNLPSFSGPAALQILRSTGFDIPFIMLSGAVSEETAVEAMISGAQDYVSKQNLLRLIPAIQRELADAAIRRNRIAAESALKASEARFSSLVDVLPLGLLITDSNGRILYANKSVERLLDQPVPVLLSGAVRLDAISPALAAMHENVLQEDGSPLATEIECVRSSGDSVTALTGMSLLNLDAAPADRQIAITLTDLTLQKKSEEVIRRTEKLAVAGRLAASISHEINNPLEAITNCLYLVEHSELGPEARQYLEMAQRELNRVSQITVQTLRFYRSSTRISRTDVHDLVDSVLTLLESRLRQAEITVCRDLRADVSLSAHDGEIRQVIVNLIGNAIDAVHTGGSIRVRTRNAVDAEGNKGIRLTIADNGTGIAPEAQERLFEPFFSTKGITGTGLGLWISRGIIHNHRGSIRVRSRLFSAERGGGTVFCIFLPAEAASPEKERERPRGTITGMPRLADLSAAVKTA